MNETPKGLNDVPEVTQLVRVNPDQLLKPKLFATTLGSSLITESGTWEVLSNYSVIVTWVVISAELIRLVLFIFFYWRQWPQFPKLVLSQFLSKGKN